MATTGRGDSRKRRASAEVRRRQPRMLAALWAVVAASALAALVRAAPAPVRVPSGERSASEPRAGSRLETAAEAAPSADDAPSQGVDVDLAVDIPVIVASGLLAITLPMLRGELAHEPCAPDCERSEINALDRPFAGRYDPSASTVSDVLQWTNVALPHLCSLIDLAGGTHPEGVAGWVEDRLILAEVAALTAMTQQIVALIAARPRPYVFNERLSLDERRDPSAYRSFYSGHTAISFASASAYSTLFGLRHPRSRWTPAVWTFTHGLAAVGGALRVVAGAHYPTDVLVGAAMGSTIGIVVPWLHVTASPPASSEPSTTDEAGSSTKGAAPRMAIVPLVSAGYAGASLTVW